VLDWAGEEWTPFTGIGETRAHRGGRSTTAGVDRRETSVAGWRGGRWPGWSGQRGALVRVGARGGAGGLYGVSEQASVCGVPDGLERTGAAASVGTPMTCAMENEVSQRRLGKAVLDWCCGTRERRW
jgi:hypothetical protein